MAKVENRPLALETTLTTALHQLAASKKAQMILAIILLLVTIRMFLPANVPPEGGAKVVLPGTPPDLTGIQQYQLSLEKQLGEMLSQVKGAGQVRVMLTLGTTSEVKLAANVRQTSRITEEKDAAGVTTVSREETHSSEPVMSRGTGGDSVVTTTELMPRINGVLVIVGGAVDPRLLETLTKATQTILSLPAHKVQVLTGK
ncbi:MAG: hypothetical protein DDT34_00896 [Firmicutes bacterium]|nr:hypothetical protein [Bacillota bacterium]MBT9157179.1 hypothetical protein [Bacillota bacterium]